jgi:hypothetical protein
MEDETEKNEVACACQSEHKGRTTSESLHGNIKGNSALRQPQFHIFNKNLIVHGLFGFVAMTQIFGPNENSFGFSVQRLCQQLPKN